MRLFFYLVPLLMLSGIIRPGPYNEKHIVPVSDGPYIFAADNGLQIRWIKAGILKKDALTEKNFDRYRKKFRLLFEYGDLNNTFSHEPVSDHDYKLVDSIGILADIHGEYATYLRLLKSAGIIDRNNNWSFGVGHLVILGDVFDRGDQVTEVLWHLFGLEKQALKAGGRVHYLLGNHEMIALSGNNPFIHEKYLYASAIAGTDYSGFFSDSTVLGRWIRTRPVMLKINDILFVHGGISTGMVQLGLGAGQVNRMFSENLLRGSGSDTGSGDDLSFLDDQQGPVWYRGYFTDSTFTESSIDTILAYYGASHIVVGHTILPDITVRFNGKIVGADTGMSYWRQNEMLFYKSGVFYRAALNGKRVELITH